jgi:hypothetical protein
MGTIRLAAGALVLGSLAAMPSLVYSQTNARLSGAQITQLVRGKSLVVRSDRGIRGTAERPEFVTRTDGGSVELVYDLRTDGSYRRLCTAAFDRRGPTKCEGFFGGSGTGVWQVQGNAFCLRDVVARAGEQVCYEIARAGARFRFHLTSGGLPSGEFRGFLDAVVFEVRQ